MECEIHRYDIRSGEHQVLQFPEEVGCFALREKGGFIVALRSGIWLTDAHGPVSYTHLEYWAMKHRQRKIPLLMGCWIAPTIPVLKC